MSSLAYPLGVDPNQVKPVAAAPSAVGLAAAPTSGLGDPLGAAAPAPPGVPAAPMQNAPAAPGIMPTINKAALALNPQLPQHPANVPDPGVFDAQYNAEQAMLAQEIGQRYNDVLKNLGYLDPSSGQFVMGRVETEAGRNRAELQRSMGLSGIEQTRQRQLEGTLFSGRRADEQARAEHPFVQGLADLDVQVPQQLTDLYEQGGNIMSEYTNRQNLLLADAARRKALMLQSQSYPDVGAPPPSDAPPADTIPDPTPVDQTAPRVDPYMDPTIMYNRGLPQTI